jgi:hypothetical protein
MAKEEQTVVEGCLEIDGEVCYYMMSVGTTDLYKAASGTEYVVNDNIGAIPLGNLLHWRGTNLTMKAKRQAS